MKKSVITQNLTFLASQSSANHELYKDEQTKLYYIFRNKDNKMALIGDVDEAEWIILYGIEANKDDLDILFPAKNTKTEENE